jgi:hypothetical protein
MEKLFPSLAGNLRLHNVYTAQVEEVECIGFEAADARIDEVYYFVIP